MSTRQKVCAVLRASATRRRTGWPPLRFTSCAPDTANMTDLRFAARILAKDARFTTVAVLLLAFGIGAGTVIFTALEAILLRPLPVRHPEQLVRIVQRRPVLGVRSNFGEPYYRALTEHSTKLSEIFGDAELLVALNEPGPARQVRVDLVTPGFFQALGVPALHGRPLTPNDDKAEAGTPPAVLSWGFWEARFSGDPRVIGQTIALRRHRFIVVGVMPPEFNGISIDT